MQGPHQVAQKFTRTYFPLCWLRLTSSPLRDLRVKSGAGTVFSDCARAMGEKNNAHAKQKNDAIFFIKIIKVGEPPVVDSKNLLSRDNSLPADVIFNLSFRAPKGYKAVAHWPHA